MKLKPGFLKNKIDKTLTRSTRKRTRAVVITRWRGRWWQIEDSKGGAHGVKGDLTLGDELTTQYTDDVL